MGDGERTRRTKQIGHVALYEGRDGKWTGASFATSDAFERHARYEISTEEYVASIRRRIQDKTLAHALLGQKVS